MIKCKLCKRQTERGESTGKFRTMVYIDQKDRTKGKKTVEEKIVCINCNGECLLK